jgi:hypothetical protein
VSNNQKQLLQELEDLARRLLTLLGEIKTAKKSKAERPSLNLLRSAAGFPPAS